MKDFVLLKNVYKYYQMGDQKLAAANDVNFSIDKGEFCVIVGPSGAGKTTILNIIGGMDSCSSGTVILGEKEISKFNERQLTDYRRYDVGFVFQFYNLVQNLTALENVELSAEISKEPLAARDVLAQVGLIDRIHNFPSQLSGGEQQRVAIARALAKNPKILLCDEPTGALDYNTGKNILRILQDSSKEAGKTVIVITHNQAIAQMADRVIHIKNGSVSDMYINDNPLPIERIEW